MSFISVNHILILLQVPSDSPAKVLIIEDKWQEITTIYPKGTTMPQTGVKPQNLGTKEKKNDAHEMIHDNSVG